MLAVALAGTAAMSAAQLTAQKTLSAVQTLSNQTAEVREIADNEIATVPGASLRPAPPAGGTTVDVSGDYILTGVMGGTQNWSSSFTIEQNGSDLTLKGFVFSDANDIEAKLSTINVGGDIFDAVVIPGDGQQVLFTSEGQNLGLYLYGPYAEQEGSFVFTSDISFLVTDWGLFPYHYLYDVENVEQKGGFGWYYETATGGMRGNNFTDINIQKCNSKFTGVETDGDIQANVEVGQLVATDEQYPNMFGVINFAGYGDAVFAFDVNTKAVVSADKQCEVPVSLQGGASASVWATSVDSETEYVLTGTIEGVDENSSVVTFPQWYLANWEFGWLTAFVSSQMTLPFNPLGETNGVESVVAGENADAPVEYFNLQGVRVLNPEAGQLVIKRQGNEVKKVVIR